MKRGLAMAATTTILFAGCGVGPSSQGLSRAEAEQAFRSGADQIVERYGWSDDFRDCITESSLSELDLYELQALTPEAAEGQAATIAREVAPQCMQADGVDLMDPAASEEQVEAMLKISEDDVESGFVSGGLTEAQAECAWRNIAGLPPTGVIAVFNGSASRGPIQDAIAGCL